MDKLSKLILQADTSKEKGVTELLDLLEKNKEYLNGNSNDLDRFLKDLDPRLHSLGYLYALHARIDHSKSLSSKYENFLHNFELFCVHFSRDQVVHCQNKFYKMLRSVSEWLLNAKMPQRGIRSFVYAIRGLAEEGEVTPAHQDLAKLALKSKCYGMVRSVINQNQYTVNVSNTGIKPVDMLLYNYYRGMLFIGLKEYGKALNSFLISITTPSKVLHAAAIEAYKKYLLVSLKLHGKVIPLPSYTPPLVNKFVKKLTTPYQDLANAFSKYDIPKFAAFVEKHQEKFLKDQNLGLVNQVRTALTRRIIQRLTSTYLTLSLQDIADKALLASTEQAEIIILAMIEENEVFATIDQKHGMVSFHEDVSQSETEHLLGRLRENMDSVLSLLDKVGNTNLDLAKSNKYLIKTIPLEEVALTEETTAAGKPTQKP
eukprot:CAMPEP_0115005668 /NCGR_PEP_ID=MMETSP0216-20121206/20021_1 /TAXON_ID=223996 /ORGANISM="Protocruzia adherens, Strain Boccale" /LENGTH=428 /DNA_ID=CAMNT_0002372063 /DNA_START=42 /DNA_END=1328 /DNA_ORIENTATION=+